MPVSFPLLTLGAAPTDGVNEVQRITPTGTIEGGTFTLTFDSEETAAIDWNATAAEVAAALAALDNVGTGQVTGSGGPLPEAFVAITFTGTLSGSAVSEMTVDDSGLTGTLPVLTVTTTTAGVRGTYRGAQGGALLADTVNGRIYQNTGDQYQPVWADLGA